MKPRRLPTRRSLYGIIRLTDDGRMFGDSVWPRLLRHVAGRSRRVVVRLSSRVPKKER